MELCRDMRSEEPDDVTSAGRVRALGRRYAPRGRYSSCSHFYCKQIGSLCVLSCCDSIYVPISDTRKTEISKSTFGVNREPLVSGDTSSAVESRARACTIATQLAEEIPLPFNPIQGDRP